MEREGEEEKGEEGQKESEEGIERKRMSK